MSEFQDRDRALSFGADARAYHRARPGYPAALFEDLFAVAPPRPRVIEIGAGTGKATVELASQSADVIAIEPDPSMAAVLTETVSGARNVRTDISDFEHWIPPGAGCADLVASAQAWHWVDPSVALPKVRETLSPGGVFAVWWNRTRSVPGDLSEELQKVYLRFAPQMFDPGLSGELSPGSLAAVNVIRASGKFAEPTVRVYPWERRSSARAYVESLGTLSASRQLSGEVRRKLFESIVQLIDDAGGSIAVGDQAELVMARRD
jgi:SAM-dependent methyltransferase